MKAGLVREKWSGTKDQMLFIDECPNPWPVTILVCGGSEMIVEEARQILHDTICVTGTIIRQSSVVYSGGSARLSCSSAVEAAADKYRGTEEHVIRSFAYALDSVPILAGMVTGVKSQQVKEGGPHDFFTYAMKQREAFDNLIGKHQQQIMLATQVVVKMVWILD